MTLLKRGSNRSVEAGSAVRASDPVDGDAVTVVEGPLPTARAGEDLHLMAARAKHPRCLTQISGDAAIGSIGRVFIEDKRDFHLFVSSSRQHACLATLGTFRYLAPWLAASRSVLRVDGASIASATPPREFAPRARRCATDATRAGIRVIRPLATGRAYAPSRYSRPAAPAQSNSAASPVAWRHGPGSEAAAAPRPAAVFRGGDTRPVTRAATLRRASSAAMRSRSRNGAGSAAD